jgi:hypothetical protein
MIFGDLQDDAKEFFIQGKESTSTSDHAEDEDEGKSTFFNNPTALPTSQIDQKMFQRLFSMKSGEDNTSSSSSSSSSKFEWSSSYFLSYDRLPDSHISPSLASKILFTGKAILMLKQSKGSENITSSYHRGGMETAVGGSNDGNRSVFQYLSQGYSFHSEKERKKETKGRSNNDTENDDDGDDSDDNGEDEEDENDDDADAISEEEKERKNQFPSSFPSSSTTDSTTSSSSLFSSANGLVGFTKEEIEYFDYQFHFLLSSFMTSSPSSMEAFSSSHQFIPQLENLLNMIYNLISNRLWNYLKDSYGFLSYLSIIRNTYLMGKGEFFQNILDDLYLLTLNGDSSSNNNNNSSDSTAGSSSASSSSSSLPSLEEMDEILNWKILRNATKLIGLDDDEMIHMLTLKIDLSSIIITHFTEQNIHYFTRNGYCQCEYPKINTKTTRKENEDNTTQQSVTSTSFLLKVNIYEPCNILFGLKTMKPLSNYFMTLWQEKNHLQSIYLYNTIQNPWNSNPLPTVLTQTPLSLDPVYLNGAIWFNDTKFLQKGFQFSFSFHNTSWNNINRSFLLSHPYFQSTIAKDKINWPKFQFMNPLNPSAPMISLQDHRQSDLLLGSIAICLQNDSRNIHVNGKGDLSRDINSSIMIGVSFHG